MGCGNPQEKLENEIMEMNINKIEIQMERYKQMKLLGEKKYQITKIIQIYKITIIKMILS